MDSMVSGQKGDGMTQEYLPVTSPHAPYVRIESNGLRCVLEEKDPIERYAEYVDTLLWIERDRGSHAIVACTFRQPARFFQEMYDKGLIQEGGESDAIAWWRLFEQMRPHVQMQGRTQEIYALLEEVLALSELRITSKEWLPYLKVQPTPRAGSNGRSSQTGIKSAPPRRPIRSRPEVA
jgi:hypothetical protein